MHDKTSMLGSKSCRISSGASFPMRQTDNEGTTTPLNRIAPGRERITPAMLTLVRLSEKEVSTIVEAVPGSAENIQDVYPLSPLQEGMLFHYLLNNARDTYQLSTLFELQPYIEVGEFVDALQKVIDRHDVLRSAILWEGLSRPVQVVYRRVALPVEKLEPDGSRDSIEQLREGMKPGGNALDLRLAPLARLVVTANPGRQKWHALLKIHHLVCDHQSLNAIAEEAAAFVSKREQQLPKPMTYRMHVAEALAHSEKEAAEEFFSNKLGGISEPTAPFGLADVHGDGTRIEEGRERLEPELTKRVRQKSRDVGVSVARLFHAAWGLVVARTSGRDDVVYGTVLSSGRQKNSGPQRLLGMSVNTLPLRLKLNGVTASELLEQTHRELTELLRWVQTPLTLAQRCSGVGGTAPLFTALLNYRRSPRNPEFECARVGLRVLARGEAWGNYPVALTVDDLDEEFELTAHTDRSIDPHRVIGYLQEALRSLVYALDCDPQVQALRLTIVPDSEQYEIVRLFNTNTGGVPQKKLVHEVYQEQVTHTPDAIATAFEAQCLTYLELNGRSNQLARLLTKKGVGPDTLVGICVERGLEMMVGVLGILKAGGAYVPLDPTYPAKRLAHMLEDAAPKVLLTERRLQEKCNTTAEVILLDENREIAEQPASDIDATDIYRNSDQLAYVIYTSGSTGRPKGVMIQHGSVLNLWSGLEQIHAHSLSGQRFALNASLNFDASVQQIVQLLSGKTIFGVPQQCRYDASMLLGFFKKYQIESADCTPSQLKLMVSSGLLESEASEMRSLLIGGEAIDPELWRALTKCSRIDFYNVYGPTECTVDATAARLTPCASTPHIGRPMENRRIYILDRYCEPSPIGVVGEIFISGAGVGRGYFNQPELTASRFVADPFSADNKARMYRTGDLGRWRPDGTVEYLGRNDDQVKIRGFRIELGEIETQLARHSQLKEAVVTVREDVPGKKQLVAYIVTSGAHDPRLTPSIEGLRAHLKASLPEYMVPSAFVVLDHLPLTPSGKLDRRALPAPELSAYASAQYEAPQGEIENLLATIWEELLGIERVGRDDNFFELGGHSLLIVRMMERLGRVGLSVDVRSVFESRTLGNLADVLASKPAVQFEAPPNLIPEQCEKITPEMLPLVALSAEQIGRIAEAVPGGMRNIKDIYPLTPLQEGLLFHHQLDKEIGDTYVTATLLLVASRDRLEQLIAALQATIDRHDILRYGVGSGSFSCRPSRCRSTSEIKTS